MKRLLSMIVVLSLIFQPVWAASLTVIIDGATVTTTREAGKEVTIDETKEGIKGWKVNSGGVTIEDNKFIMPDNDVEIEAIIPKYYLLTVENRFVTIKEEKIEGTSVTAVAGSSKDYAFTTWTATGVNLTAKQLTSDVLIFTMPSNPVTLVANYEDVTANTYTVMYNSNGGDGVPVPQTKVEGVPLTLSLTIPTKEGYNFLGWASRSSATEPEYIAGGIFGIDANTTLYAVWKEKEDLEAETYTVTYDGNGGEGAPSSQTKIKGEPLTLSSAVPTRTGYNFLGWASRSGATSPEYIAGGTFGIDSNTTLYAVWEEITGLETYTVTYNANGGEGAPSSQTKTQGVALDLSISEPIRAGLNFLGWSTNREAVIPDYLAGGTFNMDIDTTLYAVWSIPVGSYVSYTPSVSSATVLGTDSGTGEDQVFNPSDYTNGWKVFKNTNGKIELISAQSIGNLTLNGGTAYKNAVHILNTLSNKYTNNYSIRARSIGSTYDYLAGPVNKAIIDNTKSIGIIDTTENTGYQLTHAAVYGNENIYPYIDEYYTADFETINGNTALYSDVTEGIWMASRIITNNSSSAHFFVRKHWDGQDINFADGVEQNMAGLLSAVSYTSGTTETAYPNTYGVRPVVQLKAGLKVIGGDGTKNNPFILGFMDSFVDQYLIKYDGGSGIPDSQIKYHGTPLTLSTRIPTKEGYEFNGWSTTSNATEAEYQAGETFTIDANTTLYPVWKIKMANIPVGAYVMYTPATGTVTALGTDTGTGEDQVFTPTDYSEGWKVIYNNNGQLDLISAESVTNLTLGSEATVASNEYDASLNGSKTALAKAIYTLNKLCNDYASGDFALSGRNPGQGNGVSNLFYEGLTLNDISQAYIRNLVDNEGLTHPYSPYGDNPNTTEISLISDTEDENANKILMHTNDYIWLASRSIILSSSRIEMYMYLLGPDGVLKGNYWTLYHKNSSAESIASAPAKGVRPIITLKTGLKVVGGSGTKNDPYVLGYANNYVEQYSIRYEGGNNLPDSQVKFHGTPLILSSEIPTREGYEFVGWSTTSNATEAEYQAGETFTTDANTTLYAVWKVEVNEPVLGTELTPVNWDSTIANGDGTFGAWVETTEANWDYNYNMASAWNDSVGSDAYGTEGNGTARWANAMTEDGSMWVWIPRYTYKVVSGEHQAAVSWNSDEFDPATDTKGQIAVKFSEGITDDISDSYKSHPAFTLGGQELEGIWVAKYEMSMEVDGVGTSVDSIEVGNVQTNSSIKAVSKPNRSSWRYVSTSTSFLNSYNYNRELDSHLMKNVEWGAVAYLTNAVGRNPYINTAAFATGSAGNLEDATTSDEIFGYNTVGGVKGSTTHNIYGIFDLSGSVWERVATYREYDAPTYFEDDIGNNLYLGALYNAANTGLERYVDVYTATYVSTDLGDATYETSIVETTASAWNGNYSARYTSTNLGMQRGGNYVGTTKAGIYAFHCSNGEGGSGAGFRTVLTPIRVNEPVLGTELTPVNWDPSVVNADSTTGAWVATTEENWDYNYEVASSWENSVGSAAYGTEGNGTAKWANAMDSNGSLYVWIPRFTYYTEDPSETKISWNSGTSSTPPGTARTYILFSDGTDDNTTGVNGNTYNKHSAFTLTDKSGNKTELTGFWVGKYEASQGTNNVPESKAGVASWREITISEMYGYAKDLNGTNENIGAHMLKDSEWGAVIYLTSAIGRIPYKNNSSNGITGNAGNDQEEGSASGVTNAWNSENGVRGSTTHNIYGVYDMSGGSNEYVSAYSSDATTNYHANLAASYNTDGTRYVDYYTVRNPSGDNADIAWDSDYTSHAIYNSNPMMMRGGGAAGSVSGVFYFSEWSGAAGADIGFRLGAFGFLL